MEAETFATADNVVDCDGAAPMYGAVGGPYEFEYLLNFTMAARDSAPAFSWHPRHDDNGRPLGGRFIWAYASCSTYDPAEVAVLKETQ